MGTERDTPRATMSLLDRRVTAATVGALVVLAAVAWFGTVRQARGMADMVTGLGQVGGRMANDMGPPVFFAMWVTMMVAMMFPTIAPFVLAHRMVVRKRDGSWWQTGAFVGGYLFVWSAIGVVPLGAFLGFRNLAMGADWVRPVSGAVLVVAGLYQFTPWKAVCLKHCRSPLTFLLTHDFGTGSAGAFRAGISHGAYCLGCCWALMAVLVVVGLMNLVWMAAIALIFLAEKNWRRGAGLTKMVGASLAVVGVVVIAYPSLLSVLST
jgi:predicted metal-binding membrane protein